MGGAPLIPDIDMSQVEHDGLRAAGRVYYGTLYRLAGIFGRDMPAHRHDRGFQVHIIETGRLDLKLDGVVYQVEAPVLFYTPPTVPHAFRTDNVAQGHVLTVDRDLVLEALDRDRSLDPGQASRPRCLSLGAGGTWRRGREIRRLLRVLRAETEAPGPGATTVIESLATLILIAILRLDGNRAPLELPDQRRHDQLLFRRFGELAESHFADHRPLAWYAGKLAVTETRLTKLCGRVGGKPPKTILLDRSMLQARRLLAFTGLSVIEIAATLGYDDASYFSRLFRLRHGRSPLQFRREVANSGADQGL